MGNNVRFFLVDDDASVRAMLADIIEDEDFGTIEGEASDGSEITDSLLTAKDIDILIIDLLMPKQDGIETIRRIRPAYQGKIVMVSQVEIKELIGEAFSLGIEYYIMKPINRLEVIGVLTKVKERILLEKSIHNIQQSLNQLNNMAIQLPVRNTVVQSSNNIAEAAKYKLLDLGILCEGGHKDLLDILEVLKQQELEGKHEIPPLKELFEEVALKRLGIKDQKEAKASEQRVRRALHQSLEHIASLGINDFSNPTFGHYASTYFDFPQVRMKMLELEGKQPEENGHARINIKKFIQVLYMEVNQESRL